MALNFIILFAALLTNTLNIQRKRLRIWPYLFGRKETPLFRIFVFANRKLFSYYIRYSIKSLQTKGIQVT